MRKMRLEKQALSHEECEKLLVKNSNGILCLMGDEKYPYGVPVNYVYYDEKIYFHSAPKGHKAEILNRFPDICFTVVDKDDVVPEKFTSLFKSVIVRGTVRKAEGIEYDKAFRAFVEKYAGNMPDEVKDNAIKNCGCGLAVVYAADIAEITGKQAEELI